MIYARPIRLQESCRNGGACTVRGQIGVSDGFALPQLQYLLAVRTIDERERSDADLCKNFLLAFSDFSSQPWYGFEPGKKLRPNDSCT
jgi:hypothetical protein